mgnify:CR=1 FL=1|tara:strand:- start:210 stop:416 length:207 start_codon:yes stop_codon:yes gene_type:complete
MFLSADELAELSDRKRARDQIEWLKEAGYRFEISAVGRPKVLVEEVERRLLSKPKRKDEHRPRLELVR